MACAAIGLALAGAVPGARAEPADASAEASAEALFREGRRLMAAGKLVEACSALAESERLAPAPTTLLNLAGCREKAGQLATAWGLFLEAEHQLRSATDDRSKELHASALAHARTLEHRVSRLTISVPAASRVSSLEIARSGTPVDRATWDRALPIDGGTYLITARAPGKSPWSTSVHLAAERDARTIVVPALADAPAARVAVARPAPPPPARGASLGAPIAFGATGVALAGAALGLDLWSHALYDEAKAEQSVQGRRDALYGRANTRYQLAQALLVGGVACAATAAWLYVRGRGAGGGVAVAVAPSGLAIVGAF